MQRSLRQLRPGEYPPLLLEIPQPPAKLYLAGNLPPPEHKLLSVVGSRRYTSYGKEACEKLIAGLRGFPISIVSGLALGIDGIAHKAALAASLHTLAVPGSGLREDVLYPASHRALAKEILEAGGGLLSESEPDFRARPESFPQRNRIMAGLSHATLMIEGGEQSGTLVTARLTCEYNRDLLVVPGSIFSSNSHGPHLFLRLGATPIRNSADILEALGFAQDAPQKLPDNLSGDETKVMHILVEPHSRDTVLVELGLPVQQGNILLATMELKGLIKEELGVLRSSFL